MNGDTSYTTEEIAKLLRISKLTVYDLIKKGELPSYRVGRQMRVDAADLEAYKRRSRGTALSSPQPETNAPASVRSLVITGQEMSLDLLAKHLEKEAPSVRPLRAYVSSMDSLVALYRGEADIVSAHLLDGDTGAYNLPYVRKLLVGASYVVVNLLSRPAGLYVKRGNPLGLKSWRDLGRPGLRLVNRERGSGARVLLDEQLRLAGIRPDGIDGYESIETNHMGVASKVASGGADVGVGASKVARLFDAVEFVPLIMERCDLVMLKRPDNRTWIDAVLRILKSDALLAELRAIDGYDLSNTGRVWLET